MKFTAPSCTGAGLRHVSSFPKTGRSNSFSASVTNGIRPSVDRTTTHVDADSRKTPSAGVTLTGAGTTETGPSTGTTRPHPQHSTPKTSNIRNFPIGSIRRPKPPTIRHIRYPNSRYVAPRRSSHRGTASTVRTWRPGKTRTHGICFHRRQWPADRKHRAPA